MSTGVGAEQAVTLTADLVARAVIAAARAYGDDPVTACTASNRAARRALTAAASGLSLALDLPLPTVAVIFGLSWRAIGVKRAPSNRTPSFTSAERAAMRAAEFACWRPEAAESAAGGAEEAELEIWPPAADDIAVEPGGCAPPVFVVRTSVAPVQVRAPETESPIVDLILNALAAGGSLNTMSLATVIDRKEMGVASTLARLEHEGRVVAEPSDGPRRLVWRLAEPKADAA